MKSDPFFRCDFPVESCRNQVWNSARDATMCDGNPEYCKYKGSVVSKAYSKAIVQGVSGTPTGKDLMNRFITGLEPREQRLVLKYLRSTTDDKS